MPYIKCAMPKLASNMDLTPSKYSPWKLTDEVKERVREIRFGIYCYVKYGKVRSRLGFALTQTGLQLWAENKFMKEKALLQLLGLQRV